MKIEIPVEVISKDGLHFIVGTDKTIPLATLHNKEFAQQIVDVLNQPSPKVEPVDIEQIVKEYGRYDSTFLANNPKYCGIFLTVEDIKDFLLPQALIGKDEKIVELKEDNSCAMTQVKGWKDGYEALQSKMDEVVGLLRKSKSFVIFNNGGELGNEIETFLVSLPEPVKEDDDEN